MNIKTDSRKIEKGDIFVALKTANGDGHDYINDATIKGASTVVVEHGLYDVETIIVPNTKEYLINYLYNNYYEKIKSLKLIAITGTNGKTTSAYLLWQALNKLGLKSAYIGTIGFYIEDKIKDLNNTTPEINDVYEMLIECTTHQCRYVVMETSSHALEMKRLEGLMFNYAVFTNLTKDHLDYHDNMLSYALAKQKLFKMITKNGKAYVNIDDEYKNYYLLENNNNITYGFGESNYQIIDYSFDDVHTNFKIKNNILEEYQMGLLGKYNIYNVLITIMILKDMGYGYKSIRDIVSKLEAPKGRMETIIFDTNKIIIDYAHTPDAVRNIIMTIKEIAQSKIYVLIGCGGNRDKSKRIEMAKMATDLADYAIFTSDNPRFEKPEDILDDMTCDLKNENYEVIVKREEAIKKGVQLLEKNDILLLLGKGHENYQIINDKKIPFDDKEQVLKIIGR
ncbi:MAG: UDP-N-acetylmuramoyl-L-alanyl-D-glutamate--2,6-diaminopimelate ligase [Bacilli bacterium]|nr:UDP-N-acetylmuramoyl-L-alanyl-D-glutamate--2,6-diaminopimelate ligase [Bacilli bacterium]